MEQLSYTHLNELRTLSVTCEMIADALGVCRVSCLDHDWSIKSHKSKVLYCTVAVAPRTCGVCIRLYTERSLYYTSLSVSKPKPQISTTQTTFICTTATVQGHQSWTDVAHVRVSVLLLRTLRADSTRASFFLHMPALRRLSRSLTN